MNNRKIIFFIIFILTVALRLYRIDAPLGDWHSWRQSDTASVARNYLKFGFDPLRPRYDDLSSIPSGLDNPMGYRMVEFPLYQLISAGLAKTFPQYSVEVWLRLVTVAAAAGTAVLLSRINLVAGFVYAVLPYSIFFGRTILPETFAVFWAILSLSLLPKRVVLAAIAGALALLVKPTTGFLLLPVVYLLRRNIIQLFFYSVISLLPFVLWRQWISQFPEGIPAYTWLLNSNNIRFKGAWFHWLFAKRIGELMLGFWGLIPFALGISAFWGIGALLYLVVFATGNVQHDYYQILLLPAVCIFVGKGLRRLPWFLASVSFLFMLAFSWYTIRTYYWINRPDIVEAGKLADQILPKNAKVIAPYNGDTTFLYQTNRQGWPIGFDIEKKLKMGATAYVTVSPTDNDTETKQLANCYTVLVRNDRYAIIDLTKPTKICTITNP
ncbi:hypothetical protein A3A79_05115 [Candidatus Gottesmanbacteria bacterium RIFCSPLOWO2_01_FULL_43_11b]|uniref:Glycosyltransferase RgtA/B/C/D-like domain-containing protein n=1 Tax=Candidatus Gottesmanbacteria bacterium RIFCSPLOWO2_01_FULL_43_11b TaxID=1798392 RepID=A0A1F6AIL2_9BACT|nr:MAG: hypothetical protein A3A79_05115 [Candidatus Gottesmanbacteria bacterium RIFCSPLOWO2_01_FULL_43_11b]